MNENFDGRINFMDLNDLEKLKMNVNLVDLFEKITEITCDQLDQILSEEVSEEDRFINSKEFMNDFASEEFIQKNIRIRPSSGRTNADDSQKMDYMTSGPSRNMGKSTDGAKEDHNDVRTMMYEIEQQRKAIKEKHEEVLRKKKADIEKKKNQKK